MIVVDTCIVIWLASAPSLLSAAATDAIRTARKNGGMAISCISLFELAWLARNQRIVLKTSLETFLVEVEARFIVLPRAKRDGVGILSLYPTVANPSHLSRLEEEFHRTLQNPI